MYIYRKYKIGAVAGYENIINKKSVEQACLFRKVKERGSLGKDKTYYLFSDVVSIQGLF